MFGSVQKATLNVYTYMTIYYVQNNSSSVLISMSEIRNSLKRSLSLVGH